MSKTRVLLYMAMTRKKRSLNLSAAFDALRCDGTIEGRAGALCSGKVLWPVLGNEFVNVDQPADAEAPTAPTVHKLSTARVDVGGAYAAEAAPESAHLADCRSPARASQA